MAMEVKIKWKNKVMHVQ